MALYLRGAELARTMKGVHFNLPNNSFEALITACTYHTNGHQIPDITIATCWDADRLDLPRVRIVPDPEMMATAYGKRLARRIRGMS